MNILICILALVSCFSNTGVGATVVVPALVGNNQLAPGDQVQAISDAGCAGALTWQGSNAALTVWGDDQQTTEVDGFRTGELIRYQVLHSDGRVTAVDPSTVTYRSGDGTYFDGAFYIIEEAVLPVELVSFTAVADGQIVVLQWTTASETNNAGFEVQQAYNEWSPSVRWRRLGFVAGQGTTGTPHDYAFASPKLPAGRHRFRLKQVDLGGSLSYSPEVEVVLTTDVAYLLSQALPNPFSDTTSLTLDVARTQTLQVVLYNLLGKRVRLLYAGEWPANTHRSLTIDGRDMPPGLYFIKVYGESFSTTQMIIRL